MANSNTEETADLNRYCLSYREQRYAAIRQVIPDIRIRLRSKVDPDRLFASVTEALEYHPLFKTRMIRDHGLYWLVKNEAEPVIREEQWETPLVFGRNTDHRFPWAITYSENQILFTASHALSDGNGYLAFLRTVLILYLRNCGVAFSEEVLHDLSRIKSAADKDLYNPYELFCDMPSSPPGVPVFPPASMLPDDAFETDIRKISTYKVSFDRDELRQAAGCSETSLFSVMACMLARATEHTFRMNEGFIEVRIPVDLRAFFPVITEHNFVYGFSLHYDVEKMKHLPSERVETAFRSQLDLFVDRDNLIQKMKQDQKRYALLKQHPEALDAMSIEAETPPLPLAKIMYSHITRIDFPAEFEDQIAEFGYVTGSRADHYLLFMAMTRGSRIEFSVQQATRSDSLIQALKDEAARRGFSCQIEKQRARPFTVYQPEGL